MKDIPFWAILWFAMSLCFIVIAIWVVNNLEDQAISFMSMSLTCGARCEIKILQKRLERR